MNRTLVGIFRGAMVGLKESAENQYSAHCSHGMILLSFKFGGFVIGIDCPSESVDGHQAEEALHKGKV